MAAIDNRTSKSLTFEQFKDVFIKEYLIRTLLLADVESRLGQNNYQPLREDYGRGFSIEDCMDYEMEKGDLDRMDVDCLNNIKERGGESFIMND